MIARISLLILIIFLSGAVSSQDLQISGSIYDEQTSEPIPFVTILSAYDGATSNADGKFSIEMALSDSLYFSHINYKIQYVSVVEGTDSLHIYLTPRDVVLDEVIVRSLPSEADLKFDVINTPVLPSFQEANALYNVASSRSFFGRFTPTMDAQDNYRIFIAGPKDVTFFSTDPSKGLSRALKNITSGKRPYKPPARAKWK